MIPHRHRIQKSLMQLHKISERISMVSLLNISPSRSHKQVSNNKESLVKQQMSSYDEKGGFVSFENKLGSIFKHGLVSNKK